MCGTPIHMGCLLYNYIHLVRTYVFVNIINIPSLADLEGLSFSTCGSVWSSTVGCLGLTFGGLGFKGGGLGLLGGSCDSIGCGWSLVGVDGNCGLTTQVTKSNCDCCNNYTQVAIAFL